MTPSRTPKDAFGDFQTPRQLAAEIWAGLDLRGVDLLIEPTVGVGSFLATVPPHATGIPWLAWDINAEYVRQAKTTADELALKATVEEKDAFSVIGDDLAPVVAGKTVLAVGNPPWVTNAAQARTPRPNLPEKWNRFGLRGLDAKTGKANFDIAEAILLSVIAALETAAEVRLAFLVKRSVALKMARDLLGTPGVVEAHFARIDAKKWFGASVEAGVFRLRLSPSEAQATPEIRMATSLDDRNPTVAGLLAGRFVENLRLYANAKHIEAARGTGLIWRQGIKHDVSRILELRRTESGLHNGLGELVDIEEDALCAFHKSSDIAAGRPASRLFPLYQTDLSGPDGLTAWPKLAAYLREHEAAFAARGSSIYKGKPDFMLFGVGPYTRAPFKVAVSGFYKEPRFRVLRPSATGNPPLVDDTCYLLPFESEIEAISMAEYLNGPDVQAFLNTVADRTAKRPFTKELLGRIAAPGSVRHAPAAA